VENALGEFISPALSTQAKPEKITTSVEDLLQELIAQAIEQVGKPAALMDREDKKKAVRFLSDNGAMLITKSGDKISKALNISKFTLYSYLEREE
jgi:predicted transcriptional regulator YheO